MKRYFNNLASSSWSKSSSGSFCRIGASGSCKENVITCHHNTYMSLPIIFCPVLSFGVTFSCWHNNQYNPYNTEHDTSVFLPISFIPLLSCSYQKESMQLIYSTALLFAPNFLSSHSSHLQTSFALLSICLPDCFSSSTLYLRRFFTAAALASI